jgi:hypothetical protein
VAVARTVIPNHRPRNSIARPLAVERNVPDRARDLLRRRKSGQEAAPTKGREERVSGCRYVDLSYIAHVDYPKPYGSESP